MKPSCHNRLTIIGSARSVARFAGEDGWTKALQAKHVEWLEFTPGHHVCEFTTSSRPLDTLEQFSRRRRTLIFILQYEFGRSLGLVKAHRGRLEGCEVSY
jgi:hypothetical protein